jgi:site-specific DNA-methyltransferase (adenine-specific)
MKLGNYETNNIYNEDCIKALESLPNECIDFVLTDPPYNINFSSQHRKEKFEVIANDNLSDEDFDNLLNNYFKQCYRVLKKDSFLITFMGWSTIPAFNKALSTAGFNIKSMPIWVKNNFGLGYYTRPQYEPMYLCMKGNPKPPETAISDVLQYAKVQDLIHSCQKPIPLLIKLIQTFGPRGGVILDGFGGSASTAIAAMDTQNQFLVFELDKKPFNIAKERIQKRKSQPTLFDMFPKDLQMKQSTLFDKLEG